jgi:hypothetical protein
MSLTALENIIKPQRAARAAANPIRWEVIEEELGTRLPTDYKTFVEAFGVGTINNFLVVLVPRSTNQNVDLLKRGRRELEAFEVSKREFPKYYRDEVYPSPGGILPFAVTDNGEVLHWRTAGDPEQWTVTAYESRGPKHFDFNGGITNAIQIVHKSAQLRAL